MANQNSQLINDLNSSVKVRAGVLKGRIRIAGTQMELLAAPAANDIYRMVRVPSNGIPWSIVTWNDDLATTTCTGQLGFYTVAGVVLDTDAIAVNVALETASTTNLPSELMYRASSPDNIPKWGQRFWEWAGLASDPGGEIDIAWTITAIVASNVGTLGIRVMYAVD